MSNPIERERRKREEAWERGRQKDAKKKDQKMSFAEAEERVVAEKVQEEERKKRALLSNIPLERIQRDFVNFLRDAHRPVTLEEAGQRIRYNVEGNPALVESLNLHARVKVVKGKYQYKPRYDVSNAEEVVELLDSIDEGVISTELKESYHNAANDIEALKKAGRVIAIPNKQIGSEVLFSPQSKFDVSMTQALKEAWHAVFVPDVKKLSVEMEAMSLPYAKAPPSLNTSRIRKKKAKKEKQKVGRVVKDAYNAHVPQIYRDDSWKDTAVMMYSTDM